MLLYLLDKEINVKNWQNNGKYCKEVTRRYMVCVGGGAKLVEDKCYFSKFLQIHFNIKFQSLMRRMFFPSSIGRAPFSWEICGLL